MTTIREVCTTPSQALRAMCDGLERQSLRLDFIVAMNTFGCSRAGFCYGCAATCTVQEIAGIDLLGDALEDVNDDRAHPALGFDPADTRQFELAIDAARKGLLNRLFVYYGVPDFPRLNGRWFLTDPSWRDQLPRVRKAIEEMEAAGL